MNWNTLAVLEISPETYGRLSKIIIVSLIGKNMKGSHCCPLNVDITYSQIALIYY